MKIGSPSLRNSRRRQPQIKTSHIVLGILVCVVGGTIVLFGSSMVFIANQSNSYSEGQQHGQHDHDSTTNHQFHRRSATLQQQPPPQVSLSNAKDALQKVRAEFYERYGGKEMAETYLDKTITFFGSIDDTADRILRAIARQDAFVMGFAGYSITVGRGNYFKQSFPFVVERVLLDPMKAVGVPTFFVRNSAIGGIPSFPYAYCLDHFVSTASDVLSWDFSMNEMAKDPAVFEAYLRQALHQLPKRPMIIMVDNNRLRTKLLEDYVKLGILQGALTMAKADTVIPADLLQKPDDQKPRGLQQWDEFGAPAGCPGKGAWHPKMKEHEFMGWMIAMHFVEALEHVYEKQQANPTSWYKPYMDENTIEDRAMAIFPEPLSSPPPNDASVTDILFGHRRANNQYGMKELSCRTNFLPATDYDKVLQSLVVSGMATQATAENIMDARSDDVYKQGWVLDVSQVERDTKRKVESCGGLGYIDMKIAMYGIPESGPLELFLPFEGKPHKHNHDAATRKDAQHWFDGLIICEANDKRPKEACQLDRDIEYTVGGVRVPHVVMVNGAGEYLKRKTCVNVGVPKGAETSERQVVNADSSIQDTIGLTVLINAKQPVTRKDGACCLSHIVWEQH